MNSLGFRGRRRELDRLQAHLDAVRRQGQGRLLSVRGRRQVGKSRLVTEFADRSRLPQLFFTATQMPHGPEVDRFRREAEASTLAGASLFEDTAGTGWDQAFRRLGQALGEEASVVVLDEFPWLAGPEPGIESVLQAAWDRELQHRAVLMILIGSDVSTMERLTAHDRPLFGRAKELVVHPLDPAATAELTGQHEPSAAIDAHLVTGGFPRLCLEWGDAPDVLGFVAGQLEDENSDLVVVGRNIVTAEFPAMVQAREILGAIGAGERTNKAIADRAGIAAAPLARSLKVLRDDKRVITADMPVSTRPAREPRYRVSDSYLRFWLRFIEPSLADIGRGRPDLAMHRVRESWIAYRGKAVEPLVRDGLERLGVAPVVGGYWNRTGELEVDLVGVDRWPRADEVQIVGSIKWRESSAFGRSDLALLAAQRARVPGAERAALVAVSRSGVEVDVDRSFGPADLLAAWT